MADGRVVIDVLLDDSRVAKGVADIDKRLGGLAGTAKRAAASIGNIFTALGLFELARKGINMVTNALDGAISRYDTLNNFPNVMQQIGFSSEASEKAIQRLSDGIQGLPTTLDSVASTAQRIAVMTKDLDGAVETTLALNNAFIASGASQQDAARGLEQYVQMLAKGEVDLQSWRTLQETMGVALNDVAEAFGFTGASAQNDLYEALKAGTITFDEFNDKIIGLSNEQGGFAERALTASGGIRTAWTNMQTAVVRGVTSIIEAIDNVLKDTPLESIESIITRIGKVAFSTLNSIAKAIPTVVDWLMSVKKTIDPWIPSVNEVREVFISAFEAIKAAIMPIVQDVVSFIVTTWDNLVAWWQENGTQIMQAVQNAFQFILSVVQAVMPVVMFIVDMVWEAIKNIISGALSVIQGLIQVFTGIFTGDFSQMWEGIKLIFLGAIDIIVGWLSLSFFGAIRKIFMNLLKSGINIVRNMWTSIVNLFKNFGTNVQNVASNIVTGVLNFFRNLFNQSKNIFTMLRTFGASIWNALKEVVLGVARNIWSGVTQHFRNLWSSIRNSMHNIHSTIVSIWNQVMSFFRGINLYSIGKDIIKGLINGIGSMASALYNKAKEMAEGIMKSFKKILGISSPSKVMLEYGEWTGEGFEIGLAKSMRGIVKQAKNLAQAVLPDIPPTALILGSAGGSAATNVTNITNMSGRYEVVITLDGREVARATAPHLELELERQRRMYERARGER
jgi:tape measure domain-containing protein